MKRHALLPAMFGFFAALIVFACEKQSVNPIESKEKGFVYYEKGKYAEAYTPLRFAYDNGVIDGLLFFRLGYCEDIVHKQYDEALTLYRKALDWFQEHPEEDVVTHQKAYNNYGRVFIMQAEALTSEEVNIETYYKQRALLERAKAAWDEGLSVHPNNAYIKDYYARLLADIESVNQEIRRASVGAL